MPSYTVGTHKNGPFLFLRGAAGSMSAAQNISFVAPELASSRRLLLRKYLRQQVRCFTLGQVRVIETVFC